MHLLTTQERKRFKAKLTEVSGPLDTPCLIWTGTCNSKGYGRVSLRRIRPHSHMMLAHRVAWADATGLDIFSSLLICHRCDTPKCCNPDHLFEGTNKDNSDDKWRKGRAQMPDPKHDRNGNAKLTVDEVREIKKLLPHYNNTEIAALFESKITHSAISAIRRGRAWADV